MKNINVSVIITIYNEENGLHIMLDSLKKEEMQDIEFILIDNGSTDNTRQICERYIQEDSRFRLEVLEENIGYIGARNFGLTKCNGEYITFADADDYIEGSAYSLMYNAAKEDNADWVIAPYNLETTDGAKTFMSVNITPGVYKENEVLENIVPAIFGYDKNGIIIHGFMWRMLFRAKIIYDIKSVFFEEAKPKEDQLFNQLVVSAAKNIMILDIPVYNYRINPNSVTEKLRQNFNLESTLKNAKFHFEKSKENMALSNLQESVESSIYINLFYTLYEICLNSAKYLRFSKVAASSDLIKKHFDKDILKTVAQIKKEQGISGLDKIIAFCYKTGNFSLLIFIIKVALKLRGN